MKVVDLNRGCQYVDEKWTKCSRLAYTVVRVRVGNNIQQHFRCREHQGLVSICGIAPSFQTLEEVNEHAHFGLGYKR